MIRWAALALAALSSAAPAAWQEASSRHFVVYADDAPVRVQAFTEKLERFDQALRAMRKIDDPPISPTSRVAVYVVSNVAAIERLAGKEANAAGFYIPRASGSVAFVPRSAGYADVGELSSLAILLHEYSHHFMYANMTPAVFPPWYVEGFAEFNASARFEKNGDVTMGAPVLYRADGLLYGPSLPATQLLTVSPDSLPAAQKDVFYGRAWLLTHYLTVDPKRRELFGSYLGAINGGQSPQQAAALLGDGRKLDSALDFYATKPFSGITIAAARLKPPPVTIHPLSAGEAATMPARLLSQRGIRDHAEALAVAANARTLAAPYPADPGAQLVLAEAEYDAGELTAADAATDRALAADPRSVPALIFKGMTRMALARKARDAKQWTEARHWLSMANHADPEAPWPLVLYYRSYMAAGEKPTSNAEDGLLYALRLAAFDQQLSMNAARVYLTRGQVKDAEATLKPVAYNPHGGRYTSNAGKLLTMLDRIGPQRTLAKWRVGPQQDGEEPAAAGAPDEE